jgi:hypothetical protein
LLTIPLEDERADEASILEDCIDVFLKLFSFFLNDLRQEISII